MDVVKESCKKNLTFKAWQCCRSLRAGNKIRSAWKASLKSLSRKKGQVIAPAGCFPVYVGAQRQRFVVKIEFANHPLFKMLLDEAEVEYGFVGDGPIWLPCNIDLFYKMLAEMDGEEDTIPGRRSFSEGYSSFALCSPVRLLCHMINRTDQSHRAYSLLGSRFLKVNQIQ